MGVMTSSTQQLWGFPNKKHILFLSTHWFLSGTDGMGPSLFLFSPFLSVAQAQQQLGVRASIQKCMWAGKTGH